MSYYREMKEVFPEGDVHLCEEGYEHAFVIKNSEEMGLEVWGWIMELLERRRKVSWSHGLCGEPETDARLAFNCLRDEKKHLDQK